MLTNGESEKNKIKYSQSSFSYSHTVELKTNKFGFRALKINGGNEWCLLRNLAV